MNKKREKGLGSIIIIIPSFLFYWILNKYLQGGKALEFGAVLEKKSKLYIDVRVWFFLQSYVQLT